MQAKLTLNKIPHFIILAIYLFITFHVSAQTTKGKLAGKVNDALTGEEIIGATVVIEGTTNGASTDLDGRYFLQLEPGVYTILVSYISYKTQKFENIEIKAGELNSLNVALKENTQELEEVVIKGEVRKESAAGLLLQQKSAVAVSSGVSAELIRKLPDRTTADVLKRVSGATIQDGKFAIIRGMQDRYNFGMINGVPLPSSEPDRKAFSLDLIPAQVVDNMVIFKTATPDKPGEFAGGLIEITTKEVPDENTRFFNLGLGSHSLTTFKQFYATPQKSGTDWLGFDNGARQLPTLNSSLVSSNPITDEVITESKKFDHQYKPVSNSALPNLSLQAGLSQRFKILENYLGVVGMLTYSNSNLYNPYEQVVVAALDIENPQNYRRTDSTAGRFFKVDNYRNTINSGGLLNFTYKLGTNHKFFFKNLLTQTSNDNTVFRTGTHRNLPGENAPYAIYNDIGYFYQSSRIYFTQLGGEHILSKNGKTKLNYVFGLNDFFNQTPDAKKTFSRQEGSSLQNASTEPFVFNGINTIGSQNTPGRFFADLNEKTYSASADFSTLIAPVRTTIKLGGLAQIRERAFKSRYFNYAINQADPNYPGLANDIYDSITTSNIKKDRYYLIEGTNNSDSYDAKAKLLAGYLMGESRILTNLRAIYGVRVENYNIVLNSFKAGDRNNPEPLKIDTTWLDILPSLNIIYSPTERVNLRGSYSRTLSRPEFREFAPLSFFDFTRNSIFVGNSKLTRAIIDNFDLKYEYYPTPGYTFSVNPFAKTFQNPIVYVLQPAQGYAQVSLENAKSAFVLGSEFEARVGFTESTSSILKNLTAFGNLALIYSKVDQSNFKTLGGVDSTIFNTQLQGQSPYVLNLGITYTTSTEWSFTLAANTYGRRIALVGTNAAYLVYESPRLVLDASLSKIFAKNWTAKVTFGDLLAQDLLLYYDFNKDGGYNEGRDEIFEKYRRGYTVAFSISYNFNK